MRAGNDPFLNGFTVVDVTIKSGHKEFAPTWDMVMSHKKGEMTDKEYTELYYQKMRASYSNQYAKWEELLSLDKVLITCFCRPNQLCHRRLLARMLVKCGAEYWGELT